MKKKKLLRMLILALVLVLTVAASGCGSDTDNNPADDNPPDDPVINDPVIDDPVEDDSIHVSSTEELIKAIGPGAKIFVEPGYYNMSEYIEKVWADEGEGWNDSHEYVQIQECFDGAELLVHNVDEMTITGGTDNFGDTELVVNPRYAGVLTFNNCNDLEISNMTMGHTDRGDCAGNVINLVGCSNVKLDNMDLYGCGVYGLQTEYFCGDVLVTDSTIRDCEYGPLNINGGKGKVELRNCTLTGSNGGGWYEASDTSQLHFYDCSFGEWESNMWYFYENIVAENCEWSEITQYPDYGW
ncbi:MAG: right-handed parallel beta-helix repeat-containing protein [Firmicutes bacterium]|nr:right-handed parallel beta-helix repeat-containing protein [Bacillota bacterium]